MGCRSKIYIYIFDYAPPRVSVTNICIGTGMRLLVAGVLIFLFFLDNTNTKWQLVETSGTLTFLLTIDFIC